ncbi:MAG: 4'-phosphopantetheinyl transferase superfamily protein [Rikenellaceae bacterium]|nr:4'-phosphopantetheinyl transferase superfamily protein [Rikenellaceae bacterium]
MPFFKKIEVPFGFIVIWKIEEEDKALVGNLQLFPYEQEYFVKITNPHRRFEWMLWHYLVREYIGHFGVDYHDSGAPHLCGAEGYISVSHCSRFVALYYNGTRKCGVDIEPSDRNISPVISRIISDKESELIINENVSPLLIWSAKEAVYKYHGKNGVDFKRDFVLTDINTSDRSLVCSVAGYGSVTLNYEIAPEYYMVFI